MVWEPATLDEYLERWQLVPDGEPIVTPSSHLLPVRSDGRRAMLKVARVEEEGRGGMLLAWFHGHGAAPVFEADEHASLLAWAGGGRSLAQVSAEDDDEATRVLCSTLVGLHCASGEAAPPYGLVPLQEWFRALFSHAERAPDGFYARAAAIARVLLAHSSHDVVLHGDLHHANVLDFGGPSDSGGDADAGRRASAASESTPTGSARERWLAIDPKYLIGDRVFDYTNILCNPTPELAVANFERRVDIICEAGSIARADLLNWTVAWCALSATWFVDDDMLLEAALPLRIGMMAEQALGR